MTNILQWDSSFEMGIPILDLQHKILFGIYLELAQLQQTQSSPSKESIWQLVQKLQDYTQFHFQEEEMLLLESSYPDYESQHNEHEMFSRLIGQFKIELDYENPLIVENILLFVKKWLISHILKKDVKYKECVLNHLKKTIL